MKKKLLVILYTFPPYPGIGGRRWAKFAKYLTKKDYEVHVICSENPYKEQSLWCNDVVSPDIKVSCLPLKYPKLVLLGPDNFMQKIQYRLWKLYFQIFSRGVVFERTFFWEKQLVEKASIIIESENIKNVIVSIPPHRLAGYTIKLKQKYPDINFIVDYRDPWTDNKSFHGFKSISKYRLLFEQKLEASVLASADSIVSVSDKMTEMLKSRNINSNKIVTIPNGYDPTDILPAKPSLIDGKIKLVYAGTLYNDLEYVIIPLINYLNKLKKEDNSSLYSKLSFEFYGSINMEIKDLLMAEGNTCIRVYEPLPLKEMQDVINSCTFCVLITPPDYSVVFNTKFCEYLANRKPILLFTYPCDASDFIVSNKLGFHVNPRNIERDLAIFFGDLKSVISDFDSDFNIERFSIPFITTQYEKIFK